MTKSILLYFIGSCQRIPAKVEEHVVPPIRHSQYYTLADSPVNRGHFKVKVLSFTHFVICASVPPLFYGTRLYFDMCLQQAISY